jgi:hypothetical protein
MQSTAVAPVGAAAPTLIEFLPLIIVSLIYAVVVYLIAGKRRLNPWPWTIGTLVPFVGLFVAAVFMLLSFLSVFDRLNALEDAGPR